MLDWKKPVFISTKLYRAVFEDTIKLIKPNWVNGFYEGGESKNGGISACNTLPSCIGKYNVISQTATEPWISVKAVGWDRDCYSSVWCNTVQWWTTHQVSSFFHEAQDLFRGFWNQEDSYIIGHGFVLGGIVMYLEAQWRESDDGWNLDKYWCILHCMNDYSIILKLQCQGDMYKDWSLKAPQVVLRTGNIYGLIWITMDEYLKVLTEHELNGVSSKMRRDRVNLSCHTTEW